MKLASNLKLIQKVYGAWKMSRLLKISETTWFRKMRNPESFTVEQIIKIADFCEITLEELLFKELMI